MERHMSLSLDEPEVLRREMPAADAGTPGYMGDDTPGSYDADERLEAPPEGMFGDLATMQDLGQPVRPDLAGLNSLVANATCTVYASLGLNIVSSLLCRTSVTSLRPQRRWAMGWLIWMSCLSHMT